MPESIVVTVKEGKVRGFKTKSTYSKIEYYSFLGIPYGQSTAGYARFKDPVKAKPWNDTLDCTVGKDGCSQFSLKKAGIIGSEDCLYNNIHTLKIPKKGDALKPVIVFLHPGSLTHGTPDPDHYGAPDFFMHHDIVYVAVAFRLHFLGFLNLKLKNCSGNQCLKDITLSLQWIKQNISIFGGDPENVTLMGSSSGAAITHLLLLSPLTKGLYHKAVLMGSYIFNPLNLISEDSIAIAYEFGNKLGYDEENAGNERLLKFYKKIRTDKFLEMRIERFFGTDILHVYPASPFMATSTAESNENSHLPQSPRKLIPSTNRIPIMIGFSEKEAVMALAFLKFYKQSITEVFPRAIRQNCWGWGVDLNDDELKQIRKEVEDFYLDGKSIETASPQELCDIITDAGLSDLYDSLINVISADLPSSVYVYDFRFDGELDAMKEKIKRMMGVDLKGAYHAADFSYWCYFEESGGKIGEKLLSKDREMIETFTRLITTFAKTNNPNYDGMKVNWKPTSIEYPSHLVINETLEAKDEVLNGERMRFWHQLKNKYQKSNLGSC